MSNSFLLDTNAYALFFQNPQPPSYKNFTKLLSSSDIISFYISELTSLEIRSVFGKYRRGIPRQIQECKRMIITDGGNNNCNAKWICQRRKGMKPKVYRDMLKFVRDIETKKGDIRAGIIKLDSNSIAEGQNLLFKYADRCAFNSHDSVIAGTLIAYQKANDVKMTLVTSDRGLKAMLKYEKIPCLDPLSL